MPETPKDDASMSETPKTSQEPRQEMSSSLSEAMADTVAKHVQARDQAEPSYSGAGESAHTPWPDNEDDSWSQLKSFRDQFLTPEQRKSEDDSQKKFVRQERKRERRRKKEAKASELMRLKAEKRRLEEEIRDQIAEREGPPHDSSSETSSSESEPPPAAAPPPSRAFGTIGGGARLVFQKRACSSEQSQPQSAWSGLQVETGHSLADTAAQNGVIGIRAFRNRERRLFELWLSTELPYDECDRHGYRRKRRGSWTGLRPRRYWR